jgi:hypothetical protein
MLEKSSVPELPLLMALEALRCVSHDIFDLATEGVKK